jgi:hypothetical protein
MKWLCFTAIGMIVRLPSKTGDFYLDFTGSNTGTVISIKHFEFLVHAIIIVKNKVKSRETTI